MVPFSLYSFLSSFIMKKQGLLIILHDSAYMILHLRLAKAPQFLGFATVLCLSPKFWFIFLQWLRKLPDSSAYLWRRVVESHGLSFLQKEVEWSYHCLELPLHVPLDLTITPPQPPQPSESLETMGSAFGKLFWFAKSAVPGESFSVLVPWWQADHKVIGDDMMYWWRTRSVTCWMTKVGAPPFFFLRRKMNHSLSLSLVYCSRFKPSWAEIFAVENLQTHWVVVCTGFRKPPVGSLIYGGEGYGYDYWQLLL